MWFFFMERFVFAKCSVAQGPSSLQIILARHGGNLCVGDERNAAGDGIRGLGYYCRAEGPGRCVSDFTEVIDNLCRGLVHA